MSDYWGSFYPKKQQNHSGTTTIRRRTFSEQFDTEGKRIIEWRSSSFDFWDSCRLYISRESTLMWLAHCDFSIQGLINISIDCTAIRWPGVDLYGIGFLTEMRPGRFSAMLALSSSVSIFIAARAQTGIFEDNICSCSYFPKVLGSKCVRKDPASASTCFMGECNTGAWQWWVGTCHAGCLKTTSIGTTDNRQ